MDRQTPGRPRRSPRYVRSLTGGLRSHEPVVKDGRSISRKGGGCEVGTGRCRALAWPRADRFLLGQELPQLARRAPRPQACASGAECFVGYPVALIVDWNPDALPAAVAPLMVELVTATTLGLARGIRDAKALRRRVEDIAETIEAWCQENEEEADGLGLEITAQQLTGRMTVFPASNG